MMKTVGRILPKVAKTGKEYLFVVPSEPLIPGVPYNAYKHDKENVYTIKKND